MQTDELELKHISKTLDEGKFVPVMPTVCPSDPVAGLSVIDATVR